MNLANFVNDYPPHRNDSWIEPTVCIYCGESRLTPWLNGIRDRLSFVPGTWSFHKCSNCGSANLAPRPNEEKIPTLYPSVYSFRPDFDTGNKLKSLLATLEEWTFYRLKSKGEVTRLKRTTGVSTGTLLDVGCGTGERLSRFASAGFKVKGMEVQPALVEYIRSHLGFSVEMGTLDTVSYEASSFDVVTIHWVLEHVLDVKAVLQKIFFILKPNGWLVAEVPFSDSIQSTWLKGRWSQYSEAPRHFSVPSRRGLLQAMRSCGFTDMVVHSSNIIDCASFFALSAIPQGTASHTYGNASTAAHLPRLAAGILTLLYVPAALIENFVLRRPACGFIFAQKPKESLRPD
jgi:SAM-dependent methyltransferase